VTASAGEIAAFLQRELQRRGLDEVDAVSAANWLNDAGLLQDRPDRPGAPLRRLFRDGAIHGAEQRPPGKQGRWHVIRRGPVSANRARASRARSAVGERVDLLGSFALTENDVIDAVVAWLEGHRFEIQGRATTSERGIDIHAVRAEDGVEILVEAKGGTSSKPGTKRYRKPFNASQVQTHVAKALFTAAAAPRGERKHSAIALPSTDLHRRYMDQVAPALEELMVGIFWVSADGRAELLAPWARATSKDP
jgi:hypothetical protein